MKKLLILMTLVILPASRALAQDLTIYTQNKRYNIDCKNCIKSYYFFGQSYIDASKKGIIDLSALQQGINNIITDAGSSDLIVLDIENQIYQDIKKKDRSDPNYQSNISKLVGMIQMVKKLRPNAKVVLYGIPFNFNYDFQKSFNDFNKLKPILQAVDFLSPSLYLMYAGVQKDDDYFKNYINSNLDLTFQYAEKVNKPVLPFIWYKIHPYNKIFGGSIISNDLYTLYLDTIKEYTYKGKKVAGVIYWEASADTSDINQKLNNTLKILR